MAAVALVSTSCTGTSSGGAGTANPHYRGGKVTVQHISMKFFATDTSMALAFRAGEIDVAFPQSVQQFEAPGGCKVLGAPTNSSAGITMNVQTAAP